MPGISAKLKPKRQKQVSVACGTHGGKAARMKCKDVNENLLDIQGGQSRGRHIAEEKAEG